MNLQEASIFSIFLSLQFSCAVNNITPKPLIISLCTLHFEKATFTPIPYYDLAYCNLAYYDLVYCGLVYSKACRSWFEAGTAGGNGY
jgi:hypothetical protein